MAGQIGIANQVYRGAGWLVSGGLMRAVARLLVVGILARLLTHADFGLVAASMVVIAFAELLAATGLGTVLVQRASIDDKDVSTALTAAVGVGVIVGGGLFLLAGFLSNLVGIPETKSLIQVLAVTFPLSSSAGILQKVLERQLLFSRVALIEVASYLVGYAPVAIYLATLGSGSWAIVIGYVSSALLKLTLLSFWQLKPVWPGWDFQRYCAMAKPGVGWSVARLCNFIAQKADYLVVGRILGASSLGLYERAYVLMELANSLLMGYVNSLLLPVFSQMQSENERLKRSFLAASATLSLVLAPASAAAFVLAPEIVGVLLGSSWAGAVAPFQAFTVAMYFRAAMKIPATITTSLGKTFWSIAGQSIYAGLVVIGALIGVESGVLGVAVAVSASLVATYLVMTQIALRQMGLRWSVHLIALLPSVIFGVAVFFVTSGVASVLRGMGFPDIPLIFLSVLPASLVCLAALAFMPKTGGVLLEPLIRSWRARAWKRMLRKR